MFIQMYRLIAHGKSMLWQFICLNFYNGTSMECLYLQNNAQRAFTTITKKQRNAFWCTKITVIMSNGRKDRWSSITQDVCRSTFVLYQHVLANFALSIEVTIFTFTFTQVFHEISILFIAYNPKNISRNCEIGFHYQSTQPLCSKLQNIIKAGHMANTSFGRVGMGSNAHFHTFQLDHCGQMDQLTDGRTYGTTKPLIGLRVRN